MRAYLRFRSWWINEQPRIQSFKWGFACGVVVMGFVAMLIFASTSNAVPLVAHARQDSLYRGTRAEVRVYATVKAKRPGRATITVDALDTSHGNWGSAGQPTTAHVRLHKGLNRIHRTLTAEYLFPRFCAYRTEFAGDHPECPRLVSFHDPFVLVPVPFDRVLIRIWSGGRRLAGAVVLASQSKRRGTDRSARARPPRRVSPWQQHSRVPKGRASLTVIAAFNEAQGGPR